jgi:hypothetical protein
VETQYGILQSLGLQLGFEAVMKYENVEKYNIYLINDTNSDLIFILVLLKFLWTMDFFYICRKIIH